MTARKSRGAASAYYAEIREFFGNRKDLLEGRKSQVFAFRNADEWGQFISSTGFPRALGITHGDEFFYLSTGDDGRFDSKGKVQAHEMTHLVFNRFFTGRFRCGSTKASPNTSDNGKLPAWWIFGRRWDKRRDSRWRNC